MSWFAHYLIKQRDGLFFFTATLDAFNSPAYTFWSRSTHDSCLQSHRVGISAELKLPFAGDNECVLVRLVLSGFRGVVPPQSSHTADELLRIGSRRVVVRSEVVQISAVVPKKWDGVINVQPASQQHPHLGVCVRVWAVVQAERRYGPVPEHSE